jgi:hypothetical protein
MLPEKVTYKKTNCAIEFILTRTGDFNRVVTEIYLTWILYSGMIRVFIQAAVAVSFVEEVVQSSAIPYVHPQLIGGSKVPSRLNLDLLRDIALKRKAGPAHFGAPIGRLSRRSFLTLSGAGAVLSVIPPFFRGDGFDLVREGKRLHLVAGGERRWTIDPELFGEDAYVAVVDEAHEITITLKNGVFPGTACPADFACRLQKRAGAWTLHLAMACGIEVDSALLDWLNGRAVASGSWNARRFSPFDELSISFQSIPSVVFSPEWIFGVTAPSLVTVCGLEHTLPTSGFEFHFNSATSIIGTPVGRSTTVIVPRHKAKWTTDLSRKSEHGWSIHHDPSDSIFDELHVESSDAGGRVFRSALLLQSPGNGTALAFQPGGRLSADSGEPFAIPLKDPRLAFSLDQELHSSLVADIHEQPIWAHGTDASYLFAASPEAPHFEFHEGPQAPGVPQINPGICEICFPSDSASVTLKMGARRPVPFMWANIVAPYERFMGWLNLAPTSEGKELTLDLEAGDILSVERPTDLLSLQFRFDNMRLITGVFPRIVNAKDHGIGSVSVIFPPQHAAEEAFFHATETALKPDVPVGPVELADDGDPQTNTLQKLKERLDPDIKSSDEPDKPQPGIKFSGATNLAFHFPNDDYEIPCDIESLLNWTKWTPAVVPVAQSKITFDPLQPSPIAKPGDFETSIELPYRLSLSPSDLGRWAHSVKPVESKTHIVELWHTRLGVHPSKTVNKPDSPPNTIDETSTKDRTARAVWSLDFQAVNSPNCTPGIDQFPAHYTHKDPITDANPFRASLDIRDRCELVHLTSNYAITQQAAFCPTPSSPLPANPLLLPAPVQINRLMLTSMGGYLEAFGQWNPCKVDGSHQLTVQMWEHIATLGRDHYVKVVYKGYLAPFGLRASLVKVTQRYFELNADKNWVAILHQHMYIVVKKERKQCPVLGQPYGGRAFPFSYVEPVTVKTPFLSDPAQQKFPRDPSISQAQSLFWPMVPDAANTPSIFSFRLRFTDITGVHSAESSMPLLFVASDVAQGDNTVNPIPSTTSTNFASQDAVYFYNRGSISPAPSSNDPYLTALFSGQKFSFAASAKPGDTDFETDTISWRAAPVSASVTLTVSGADGKPYGATNPSAYATITSAVSGNSIVQTLTSQGPYALDIESGSITVSVTTPNTNNPASVVSSSPLPVSGSLKYKLDLKLTDASHFAVTPALVPAGANTSISPTYLYHYDLPFFYPAVDYALITSTSIKRVTGITTPTKFTFYPTYLSDGFNTSTNLGEVLLQKHPDDTLPLQFGGANGSVDKAGGLASPDALVVGFSRKGGPVGGKTTSASASAQKNAIPNSAPASNNVITSVSTFSSGKFDPADFFGGLLSAKLLGAVNLSDIIAPLASGLSNLAQAPQMIEQALYTAEKYTTDAAKAIADFQQVPGNPLASRLAAQSQQVASAAAALAAAQADSGTVGAAVAEAQLVARIADYTTAVQGALQNPLSLVEDAVISALTPAVQGAINSAQTATQAQIAALSQALSDQLDVAIQNVVLALAPLATAMTTAVADAITAADQTAKILNQPIQSAISYLAPDLNNVAQLVQLVPALKGDISQLGSSIKTALSNPTQLPQVLVNASNVLTDLQQIYQNAGFLGVVVSNPTLAALNKDRDNLRTLWNYADYTADLTALHDNCLKLASYSPQTAAQQILQSLNQLETSVQKAALYKKRVTNVPPQPMPVGQPLGLVDMFRELQLLQNIQGQILSALAALQNLALAIPKTAPSSIQMAAVAVNTAAPTLAAQLTVVSQLWNPTAAHFSPIETQLADLTSDANATKPINASTSGILQQIVTLRAGIVANPTDVGLQLLLYNLNIDYQRPLATALAYVAYIQTSVDTEIAKVPPLLAQYLPPILALIETVANTLQALFCALSSTWSAFRNSLQNLQGPLDVKLGPIIDSLFGSDLDAVGAAFVALCASAQTTPSEYLRNSRSLIAAFVGLEKDVRAKITSLPAVEAALLQVIQTEIDTLLATLLADIPIPTSVNLSYTWNPTIQSCAPVFLLNPDAAFAVTASAQAGLTPSLSVTAAVDISASLTNFSIALIGEEPFITLVIDSLTFTSHNGSKPDVRLTLNTVVFGAAMQFVQDLADLLDPTDGPFIELAAASIRAGFRFAIESMTLGAFNLMQLAIEVAVALPFDGTPVRCEMGLSDQQQPFLLSCGIYGGGGFLQLQLGLDGVQLLQGAFEFGVCADISIGPLVGSGFVVAGIYFSVTANSSEVCGFVHAHGHMDVFGIITLDVDLYVAICYESGSVQGIATFSVSVSIAFFSESFSMQAQYSFAGSGGGASDSSATLEVSDHPSEAFLVSPGSDNDIAIDAFLASIPARTSHHQAKTAKHLPRPPHKTIEPGHWQQLDPLVDETIWEAYYNSFVSS